MPLSEYNEGELADQSMDGDSLPVSVVTGVFNGQSQVAATVESILDQTMADFEFIIVDDGSTDETPEILSEYSSRDKRVRVIRQENAGLTHALRTGCRVARGKYIARQDVGDRSMPERFEKQVAFMEHHPEVVAVGAGSRRVGPEGEFLGESVRSLTPQQVTDAFLRDGVGISHTVALFRRNTYEKAGGYRPEFRFAQDTDLWCRMSRFGLLAELPEILFEWGIDLDGISSTSSDRQRRLAELARQSRELLERDEDDQDVLRQAAQVSSEKTSQLAQSDRLIQAATAEFFIGSQLYALGDRRCRDYLRRAIHCRPLWPRPWAKLAMSYMMTRRREC